MDELDSMNHVGRSQTWCKVWSRSALDAPQEIGELLCFTYPVCNGRLPLYGLRASFLHELHKRVP